MILPADSHVHSEWSWDAPNGAMERTCGQAVRLGLPAVAFTEHLDHTVWQIPLDDPHISDHFRSLATAEGVLTPPPFRVEDYLANVDRCRTLFPSLKILTGLELGEPHWHAAECAEVLAAGPFDRVLGSLHRLPEGAAFAEPRGLFTRRRPAELVREYLAGIVELVASDAPFTVLAHIDFIVRYWPADLHGPFDPAAFEDEFRAALRATADSGRALEINTRLPLDETILRWWHDEGGDAVTFGSDAHLPADLGRRFREAVQMAEACGFHPTDDPVDLWRRG